MTRGRNELLHLSPPFDELWRGRDVFDEIAALEGTVYRDVPGRRTLRFRAGGRYWFLKHHTGIGRHAWWVERLRGRVPVIGADNEWRAIRVLEQAGIRTLDAVAFGQRGDDPARRESFLISADLEEQAGEALVDLETLCAGWVQRPPPPRFRWRLIRSVAEISRRLHSAGMIHRDYYLCHFLLPVSQMATGSPSEGDREMPLPEPVLIDLHRALFHPRNRDRWIAKDLAGLLFSAHHAGLTSRDIWRFITAYTGLSVRDAWCAHRRLLLLVERRARRMLRREQRRQRRLRGELLVPPGDGLVARWQQADDDGRALILRQLCMALRRCHERGWLPVDRALRDVREIDGDYVIELTGAGRLSDTLATEQARRCNLADFLSWFPQTVDCSLDDPQRSPAPWAAGKRGGVPSLARLVEAARVARWHRTAPALYRDSAQVRRRRQHGRVIVQKRYLTSPDWTAFPADPDGWMQRGEMIKDGDSTTVVRLTLGGRSCVVKRYNMTGAAHALRRAPQRSRAWWHWYHAHRLLTLGVQTPEPLLAMEQRLGPLRRQAWLVTEAVEGRNLLEESGTLESEAVRKRVMKQFLDWFVFMRRHRVNHGDLKISNFISQPDGLVVLDPDGTRWPTGRRRFERGLRRDEQRFLRNWQDRPQWREEAERMLRAAGTMSDTDALDD